MDDDGYAIRQLEVYANGRVMKYDENHGEDEFGGLAEYPLEPQEFAPFEISGEEFEAAWRLESNEQWGRG